MRQSLKGMMVRATRRIRNNAGEIIQPGEYAIVTRHRRDGTFDLHKPAAHVNGVERSGFEIVGEDDGA